MSDDNSNSNGNSVHVDGGMETESAEDGRQIAVEFCIEHKNSRNPDMVSLILARDLAKDVIRRGADRECVEMLAGFLDQMFDFTAGKKPTAIISDALRHNSNMLMESLKTIDALTRYMGNAANSDFPDESSYVVPILRRGILDGVADCMSLVEAITAQQNEW